MGKILVADDSSTIQKVVRITLANESFDLVEAMTFQEVENALKVSKFDLILYDYGLDANVAGKDAVQKIRESSDAPILAMLGTFDSVDHAQITSDGFTDSIVKPFDGDAFVVKCHDLIDGKEFGDTDIPAPIDDTEETSNDELEGWTVKNEAPMNDALDFLDAPSMVDSSTSLDDELNDWGMEVPGVIGEAENDELSESQLPPVIKGEDEADDFELEIEEEVAEPGPTEEEDDREFGIDMVSLDDLSTDEVDDEKEIEVDTAMINTQDDELEKNIEDELSEDDLWSVDEEVNDNIAQEVKTVEDAVVEEAACELKDDIVEELQEEVSPVAPQGPLKLDDETLDKLAEKLRESLAPMIETVIRQECMNIADQAAEKVAWEVIPDVAENLVKEEIKKLTEN